MELKLSLSLICVLVLFLNIGNANSSCPVSNRRITFYSVENSSLGIRSLGSSFTSDSKAICASTCPLKYPSTCQSFIYDPVTKQCLPGGELGTSKTKPQTGQLMYSNCDLSLGYSYSVLVQFGYCVYVSLSRTDFVTAENVCQNISGRLMKVDNLEKLQFLNNYTSAQNVTLIWIGLDDMANEGTYMWSDQTQANVSEMATLFLAGEPNDKVGIEDCVEFVRSSAIGLNDVPCNRTMSSICEYVV